MYHYRAELARVVDGDTAIFNIDLGMGNWVHGISMRLSGINAPEPHTETRDAGDAATKALAILLDNDWDGTIRTHRDRRGKFGRYLVELPKKGGGTINDDLVKNGFAVSYMRGE